jgi:3-oxoisoapionate decarboxylase
MVVSPMKIGLDTYSFHILLAAGRYDVFRALDWLAEAGFAGWQININGPHGRFLGGDPGDVAHVRRVRRAIEAKGFFVELGGMRTAPEHVGWQLQLAADLGADVFRTLVVFQHSLDHTMATTRRDLEAVLPLAHRLGVKIALENHEDITAAELRSFLDTMPDSHLGATLDTGNDLVVYGDPVEAARQLAPRAFTTHIKDHRLIRVGGRVYSVGVPLGQGDLPLREQLRTICTMSPLDRVLLQDTSAYSSVLNPFGRADLQPREDYAGVFEFLDAAAAAAAGYRLNLEGLSPEKLKQLAQQQEERILHGHATLRALLQEYCGAIALDK